MASAAVTKPDSDVLVSTETAADFFAHLRSQGRTAAFTGAADAQNKLAILVEREWGGSKCRTFKDNYGGGWLMDLSDFVEGEALVAIIRTVVGRRTLMAIVDESEVDEFSRGKDWTTPAARSRVPPGIDADALRVADEIENRGSSRPPPPQTLRPVAPVPQAETARPEDPMLVLVIEPVKEGDTPMILHHERCTRAEVPGVVKMLLRRGYLDGGPLPTEEQIEVWGSVSRPTLEVRF